MVFMGYVGGDNNQAVDVIAKKLAQIYLPINVIDAIFWVFGFISLRINIGDNIHEESFGIH
jgi:hypothetical protein